MGQKKYEETFKQKIVGLYNSGRRQADLMREFGLPKCTIQDWRKRYTHPIALTTDGELSEVQKDNIALHARVRQLELENEILKSATEWVEKKRHDNRIKP